MLPEIPIHKVLLHPPTPLQIQIEIAKFYSIKLESLRHKNIEKKSVHRGLAMYLCVKYSDKKLCVKFAMSLMFLLVALYHMHILKRNAF